VNGNDKKEKMLSLQAVIYTGPPKSREAKILQKQQMPYGKQGSQSKKMAR
jgi:hypothetical protein